MNSEPAQLNAPFGNANLRCVVGIGASAGGLKPLEAIFDHLADTSGMAFIVVQHLSAGFKSAMDEILSRRTTLRIVKSEHGMTVEPDRIYLIAPKKNLTIESGRFVVETMEDEIPKPIDRLFESLGSNYGVRSVAIVLSGLTVVQDPKTAQFDGMPNTAISTDCIDTILDPEGIAELLVEHARDPVSRKVLSGVPGIADFSGMELIFSLISDRHGINFADYKTATVARRLERRLRATSQASIDSYAQHLLSDSNEIDILFNDMLIGVTNFFRDADAFRTLQSNLNLAVTNLPESEELRIWCAGCASGEEAYTLGILALEAFERKARPPRVKILATDLHQPSLDFASRGEFHRDSLRLMTEKRQAKHFSIETDETFRVNADLRRNIVFARHDVVNSPPFSRIHLVTCRNLLIYLQGDAQERVIGAFHFSLVDRGMLMLGGSESLGRCSNDFEVIHDEWRLYRKQLKNRSARSYSCKTHGNQWPSQSVPRKLVNTLNLDHPSELSFLDLLAAYDSLVSEYITCGFLVATNRRVLHTFGRTGRYVVQDVKPNDNSFLSLFSDEPRMILGGALSRGAEKPFERVTLRNVRFENGEGEEPNFADVKIRALSSGVGNPSKWLIEFIDSSAAESCVGREVTITNDRSGSDEIATELAYTKESLSATIEQLESSNEELMATNEELTASNEELQSANEELSSVNEEHHSVNAEYQRKVAELEELSQELDAFIGSSDIGTLFLDTEMKIRRFSEAIRPYFDLMPHDIGRTLASFSNRLKLPNFNHILEQVVESGEGISVAVSDECGKSVLLRVSPCASDGVATGIVVNVVAHLPFGAVFDREDFQEGTGVWEWPNVNYDRMWWSPSCFKLLGYDEDGLSAQMSTWIELGHSDDNLSNANLLPTMLLQNGSIVVRLRCGENEYQPFEIRGWTQCDDEGDVVSMSGSLSAIARPPPVVPLETSRRKRS